MMRPIIITLALLAVSLVRAEETGNKGNFDLAKYESKLKKLAKANGEQELVAGVTVSGLLALSLKHLDREKCSRADLLPRWFTCEMLRPNEEARQCCVHYLDQVARFCAREVLGQNPDQFDAVRRPFVKWANLRKMDEKDRVFWRGILKFAEGQAEAMWKHLTYGLVPEGDSEAYEPRFELMIDSAELLDRGQLMDMLKRVGVLNVRTTLAILSRAKDKAKTELVKGVTVADLLRMNDISQPLCETPDEIIRRTKQCLATIELISVRQYCKSAIRGMGGKCLKGFGKGDFDNWWFGVYEGLQTGLGGFLFRDESTGLERYMLEDPAVGRAHFDYIMSEQFVEDRKRRAQEKRDRQAQEELDKQNGSESESGDEANPKQAN